MNDKQHLPVLLEEFLKVYEGKQIKRFIDGTLGAGGHSEALLKAHPEIEKLYGFDQDESAIKIAKSVLEPFKEKVEFVKSNYCDMQIEMKNRDVSKVDGILLDIGVSSMQIDTKERGFSFSKDGPLDMRMDQSCTLTAKEIVNHWSEKDLQMVFRDYGDVPKWRQVTKIILEKRKKMTISTTLELVEVLEEVLKHSKRSLNPMTLAFQGLRIAVNNELLVLDHVLPRAASMLNPEARLSVICFHSGEDRIVKNAFKAFNQENSKVEILTKKPIVASKSEERKNPRSRSAKMRVLEAVA